MPTKTGLNFCKSILNFQIKLWKFPSFWNFGGKWGIAIPILLIVDTSLKNLIFLNMSQRSVKNPISWPQNLWIDTYQLIKPYITPILIYPSIEASPTNSVIISKKIATTPIIFQSPVIMKSSTKENLPKTLQLPKSSQTNKIVDFLEQQSLRKSKK